MAEQVGASVTREHIRYKNIDFQSAELSPLAENGVRYYEDCAVGFRVDGEKPIDISVKLGLDHPDLPYSRGRSREDPMDQRFEIWQPEIYRGYRTWEQNYRQPSHGLRLPPGILQGYREGSLQDIFDFAVAPVGSILGVSIEINGEAFDLTCHNQKPFSPPSFRPIPVRSDFPPYSLIETKGPKKRKIEKVFSRSGLMAAATYRNYPYARQLVFDKDSAAYKQLPSRFKRVSSPDGERGVVRLKGLNERKIGASGTVTRFPEVIETRPTQLLNIVIFNTIEDLVPFDVEKITGYKSAQEYIERIATDGGRCPISGHMLNPNATEADFGAIIRTVNKLAIRPKVIAPVVQFNLAIVGATKQSGLEPYGIAVETCPSCYPTKCYGAHEREDEVTICPDCNTPWNEEHVCLTDLNNILDEYFIAEGFSEDLVDYNQGEHPHSQMVRVLNEVD